MAPYLPVHVLIVFFGRQGGVAPGGQVLGVSSRLVTLGGFVCPVQLTGSLWFRHVVRTYSSLGTSDDGVFGGLCWEYCCIFGCDLHSDIAYNYPRHTVVLTCTLLRDISSMAGSLQCNVKILLDGFRRMAYGVFLMASPYPVTQVRVFSLIWSHFRFVLVLRISGVLRGCSRSRQLHTAFLLRYLV